MNTKSYTKAAAGALLLIAGTFSAEARMSKELGDTASTGLNALDYVLQRPLRLPEFENKHFGDHLFLSAGGGLSTYDSKPSGNFRPGFHGEITVGDWVTPVHGWRFTLGAGTRSRSAADSWTYYGSASADYLMNFSALLRGYNPARRVEVIGALGAEYRRLRYQGAWGNALGLRAALQLRFNVQRNLYLYAEPRLAVVGGTRFAGDSFRRYHYDFSFNVGMGYNLLDRAARLKGATQFATSPEGHLFFGIGGGVWGFARKVSEQYRHPFGAGSIYVGKYFSPVAGLRVKAEGGRIGQTTVDGNLRNRYLMAGSLDFVWNLNSAFGGYRPGQVFDLALNIGPALAYADKTEGKIYPGAEASLTALFRLSPNWGIYIEPEAKMFARGFNRDLNGGGSGPFVSLTAGVRYTFGNFKLDFAESYDDWAKSSNSFLSIAAGPAKRWKGNYGKGMTGMVSFGHRFTPISSWRISAEGDFFSASPGYMSVGAGADYLASISTGMAGFNPRRVFDLSALVGVTAGAAQFLGPVRAQLGARAGLHGDFRLNDALDLFVEPQIAVNKMIGGYSSSVTPELRVMLGLKYKLGNPAAAFGTLADSPIADGRNFVSLSGGPSACTSTFLSPPRRVGGTLDISAGRWLSRVSGLRIGYGLDIVSTSRKGTTRPLFSTIHADYMLNITSAMDHDPGRRFHIIGIAGTGVGFSNLRYSQASPVLNAGVQFRYNLPCGIDVHLEPNTSFYLNRMAHGYTSGARFLAQARLMAGASYRF